MQKESFIINDTIHNWKNIIMKNKGQHNDTDATTYIDAHTIINVDIFT